MINKELDSDQKIRFEFKGRISEPVLLFIASAILAAVFWYIGLWRFPLTPIYVTIILVMMWVFYFRAVCLASDLVIDNIGLRRYFIGFLWRKIKWQDVKLIRAVFQRNPSNNKLAWFIFIYTYDRSAGWKPSKVAVIFTDKTDKRDELLYLLNKYIENYQISVQERNRIMNRTNTWSDVNQLNFKYPD